MLKLITSALLLASISCSQKSETTGGDLDGRISPSYDGPTELSYCSTPIVYGGTPSTITGTAQYTAREIYGTALTGGLGAAGTARPIKYAEVRVTNSSGSVVQCAETDVNGQFSFDLPAGSGTFTIAVNARANNSEVKVSVMDAPERNNVYKITTTVVPNTSKSVGTITASATASNVIGGAFNIYDQILNANDYLRAQAGGCSSIPGCTDFTVAPKVSVYWEKGFNPGDYFGNGPVSFYLPSYHRLFILGGVDGNINSADTDHFDNSVIIHEYGHFLEDIYAQSDSPGGSHSGNALVDPRLAWSEGWGNFIQGAVLNNPYYIDTVGNSSGSTSYTFYINIESGNAGCASGSTTPGCDYPDFSGEGSFREFAVTRTLFDAIDTPNDGETTSNAFDEIWAALTKTSGGLANPNAGFKDSGLFFFYQAALSLTDFTSLRGLTLNRQPSNRSEYATYLATGSACSMNLNITPYLGGFENAPHIMKNNDFYHIKHTGGTLSITISYKTRVGATSEADLDFYLYNEDARIGNTSDILVYNEEQPDNSIATTETKTLNAGSQPAGNYLIQVLAWDGSNHITDYEISKNPGGDLCPATLP